MSIINKTIFPDEMFERIEKKDAYIALLFSISLFIFCILSLYLVKSSSLFPLIKNNGVTKYFLLFVLIMELPGVAGMVLILKYRKQSISTIGIRVAGLKSSLVIGGTLLILKSLHLIYKNGFNTTFIYKLVFYLLLVGFYEEVIFRGFLWPRLVVGFGKVWGTILSALLFWVMHIPNVVIFNNKTLADNPIDIPGSILITILMVYIYTRNNNIILPSFIHCIVDLK
jgi:membrane protease YdiL (CAAX protease family)